MEAECSLMAQNALWTTPMENESEFYWPGVGTLKITGGGIGSVSLRYMPDLSVIASELAKHRTAPSQEPHSDGEQSTHPKP